MLSHAGYAVVTSEQMDTVYTCWTQTLPTHAVAILLIVYCSVAQNLILV